MSGLKTGTSTDSKASGKMAGALGGDRQKGHVVWAVRAYFGALDVLKMTNEQSEDNFERKTTWTSIAIDFEIATATKIPTARGQTMAKGME